MAQSSSLEQLQSMLDNTSRSNILNLQNCTTDYCFGTYLMRKQRLGISQRKQTINCREKLRTLSASIPTYRFDEDFNTQLFHHFIRSYDIKPSSAVEYMRAIIAVLGWSGKHGAELSDSYNYIPKVQYQSHTIALTMSEVSHIYHFDINTLPYRRDKREMIERVKDTFVMNAIGYGLRYSDLSRLDNVDFNTDGTFQLVQKKTGRVVHSNTDLVYYHDIYEELQRKYPDHKIPYQGDISSYNKYLKEICKHLHGTFDNVEIIEYRIGDEIIREERPRWHMISSHVARRTFVTCNILALHKSVVEVQQGVGHAQSSTTDRYVKGNGNRVI